MRILGIDPGLRTTGFGVVEKHGSQLLYIASGTIRTNKEAQGNLPERLKVLFDGIHEVVERYQANERIIDSLVKSMGLPDSVEVARDIRTTGNTSSASIPLAMDRMLEEHPELHGKNALLIGFGAGLVFAAQVVELPPKPQ